MKLTFGICTAGGQEARIQRMLESIAPEAPGAEVIVIGGAPVSGARHLPFDESRPGWITRKKNVLAREASNPVLVLMHDYVRLLPGWGAAWESFGDDWDVSTNVMLKEDGTRAFDWFAIDYRQWLGPNLVDYRLGADEFRGHMYPAGNYFLVKRDFLLANPLDESLCWGQNEDYKWMKQVYASWRYRLNPKAVVQYMKPHHHNPNYSNLITKS